MFLNKRNPIFALSVAATLKPVKSWQQGKFFNVGSSDDFIMSATAFRLMNSAGNKNGGIIIKRKKCDLSADCETKECVLAF